MNSSILFFIIFVVLLFVGIAIMMKPGAFVSTPVSNEPSSKQLSTSSTIPRVIIIMGSALTISGLVGISIQGFSMFKVFDREQANSN